MVIPHERPATKRGARKAPASFLSKVLGGLRREGRICGSALTPTLSSLRERERSILVPLGEGLDEGLRDSVVEQPLPFAPRLASAAFSSQRGGG